MVRSDDFTPETEGMANVEHVPLSIRLTGSTGFSSLTDSGVRGTGAAGILSAIQWVLNRWVADFTVEDWNALLPVLTIFAFIAWGVFDKIIKPRIGSS